jgi:hypothetical protein
VYNDEGVNVAIGEHGRYAQFRETRSVAILPDTSKYKVGLTRGEVTTSNIPLFCPNPSEPVTVNGVKQWEVSAQPGISMTWTGPAYATSDVPPLSGSVTNNGFIPAEEIATMSWPTFGLIPYYTYSSIDPNQSQDPPTSGVIDLSTYGGSDCANCTITEGLRRLNDIFKSIFPIPDSTQKFLSADVAGSAMDLVDAQVLNFTNDSATTTVVFDFSSPFYAGKVNDNFNVGSGDTSLAPGIAPSWSGILQACKLLGFAPNTTFVIPPGAAATPCPRILQLGFRSVFNMAAYKTVRWVPEDKSNGSFVPTADQVVSGKTSTYFDGYSYQHFLTQCVNPALSRCIYDEFDAGLTLVDQCLTRQLQKMCWAQCTAGTYLGSYSYIPGDSCVLNGRTFIWTCPDAGVGTPPLSGGSQAAYWLDIGPSFSNSWVSGTYYTLGDMVTRVNMDNFLVDKTVGIRMYTCKVAIGQSTNVDPLTDTAGTYWTRIYFRATTDEFLRMPCNVPSIGTIPPTITFNSATQLFSLNLDSYGFGGTQATNANDGFGAYTSDSGNPNEITTAERLYYVSSLNDQARDSWGLTGVAAAATPVPYVTFRRPWRVFDERCSIEADDYFNQLFGNWPNLRLVYEDKTKQNRVTAYVRYIPDAVNGGLTVPVTLPLFPTLPTPTVTSVYLPYFRVENSQPYIYTFPQDYRSIGNIWNPVDTLVLTSPDIPLVNCQVAPPYIITDIGPPETQPNANIEPILAEFAVYPTDNPGQEYRRVVTYAPTGDAIDFIDMQHSTLFNNLSWNLWMRMKTTQRLRPVSISDGGAVNIRLKFVRRD